jgi:hypothetical protein
MRSNNVSDFTLTRETQVQLMSAYLGPGLGPGLHGCKSVGARILATVQLLVFLGSFLAFACTQQANAEFLLYIKETRVGAGPAGEDIVNFLRIEEGDVVFDKDQLATSDDFMDIKSDALSGHFEGRWSFDEFFFAFTTLGENPSSGLPAQVINIEFGVTKETSENSRLEVLATYKGSNGSIEPTFLQMFGGGNTSQGDLDFTFVGSFNHERNEEFYTNDYVPESDTGTEFVFIFKPVPDLNGNYDILDGNDLEPTMLIDGDSTYSLTYGVLISNLENGERFDTLSGMDYVLPEPTSMVTWAAVVGLAGFTAKRRRKHCDK